ncbi:MAG: metallophosphoesterase [Solirubrobacterales bacterium]
MTRRLATCLAALLPLFACSAAAAAPASDTLGKTTVEQRIVADAAPGFRQLSLGAGGEGYVVREEGVGRARAGRAARRRSLVYLGQLSDFQLADEESPSRVEALDSVLPAFSAAFRPWEALEPQIDDAMVRQLNAFAGAGPVPAAKGRRPAMDFAIDTGDSADSQQLNETEWVRTLLEGGALDPNSGTASSGDPNPLCAVAGVPGAAEAARYTGVQDTADYPGTPFYAPDLAAQPPGRYSGFPQYTGLMDRAQAGFDAAGLDVPSYVAFGNHDGLVQGNVAATTVFETVATGCIKPLSAFFPDGSTFLDFSIQDVLDLHDLPPGGDTILTPPDPDRRYVSKSQFKQVFESGSQADGHGFDYVDDAEETASRGAAGYYGFSPRPGIRMIALDTVSEGGVLGTSAEGNVDDPQFRWLRRELRRAARADELVILFSHHAIDSLTADVADEVAPACGDPQPPGPGDDPGCDVDPRDSTPIHLGDDLVRLLHRNPHVIAWVAGHSHVNRVEPYPDGKGGGFWMVRVAAEADWPQQARLLQLFDNRDGTLSLFGTVVDHAGSAAAPPSGPAGSFGVDQLASLGRTLAYNDPDSGARRCSPDPCGEGAAKDRNVELLISDPRRGYALGHCANRRLGDGGRDRLVGTRGSDRLLGRGGRDRLIGLAGGDCIEGGTGADRMNGGAGADRMNGGAGADRMNGGAGADRIRGGAGADRISGGAGADRIRAGSGDDVVDAADGERDRVACGPGRHDRALADRRDSLSGCERVRTAG